MSKKRNKVERRGLYSEKNICRLLSQVRKYACACDYEKQHSEQVAVLAVELFDLLKEIHAYGSRERFCLEAGGLLHDIGWLYGQPKHHKNTMRMILEDTGMPLDIDDRTLIAQIARYHRKALPKAEHTKFLALTATDQTRVSMLAGILRVADGLDRTHTNVVKGLSIESKADCLIILCRVAGPAIAEMQAAGKKSDLLAAAIGKEIVIEVQ